MALPLKKIVSRNVKTIRKRQGLSQVELAERSGLSVRYLSKVENDPMEITLHNLERIATGLGVSAGDLVQDASGTTPQINKQGKEAIAFTARFLTSLLET